MKIIKEGDLNRFKKPLRFSCTKCGCEFEAYRGEYEDAGSQYNQSYYKHPCPTCGNMVYTEE